MVLILCERALQEQACNNNQQLAIRILVLWNNMAQKYVDDPLNKWVVILDS
jgi:hypothetical protein